MKEKERKILNELSKKLIKSIENHPSLKELDIMMLQTLEESFFEVLEGWIPVLKI